MKPGIAECNALARRTALAARYFGVRHGESMPSAQQRICSAMAAGVDTANGLTPAGRDEVTASAADWLQAHRTTVAEALSRDCLWIFSSPFSRALQSAEILAETLSQAFGPVGSLPAVRLRERIRIEPALRERDFGDFEGHGDSELVYQQVWREDALDPSHSRWQVESAAAVQHRVTTLVAEIDTCATAHGAVLCLLVSHGDTLKILETGLRRQSPALHQDARVVRPFRTGEIRPFKLD